MEDRAHALVAGLFVLVLGLAAGFFVWWLGQNKQDVDYYLLETRQNVTGLNVQAPVRYRGIRAGRVESMDIDAMDRSLILVRISLDSRFPLTAGTTAKLNTQGVTGLAYVQLEDDSSNPRPLVGQDGKPPRIVLKPTLLDTLGAQAGDIVTQANLLAMRLEQLLDDRNLKNFARALDNLATVSDGLKDGLKDLPAAMAALRQTLSDSNVQKLSAVLANLEKTTGEATPLAQEMREMVRTMSVLANRLDKIAGETGGELTATTVPRANAMIQELTASARRLSRLIETLDRNPQALVFGRGEPAPGPGEAGFMAPGR
ncbi:MAG TPA: MlaD family protein [Rhodocyclaceae bacterium]|nr:MlaD family protein [Rhodocyclaceae bacterium]